MAPSQGLDEARMSHRVVPIRSDHISTGRNESQQSSVPPGQSIGFTTDPHARTLNNDVGNHRFQLPGVHELLSPVGHHASTQHDAWSSRGVLPTPNPSQLQASPFAMMSGPLLPPAPQMPQEAPDSMPGIYPYPAASVHRPVPVDFASASRSSLSDIRRSFTQDLQVDPHFMASASPTRAYDGPELETRRDSARTGSLGNASSSVCVGQRQIPGRGLCYVYSDGAICPTLIDGEVVNPVWGTTKAGKARKRLAQACLLVLSQRWLLLCLLTCFRSCREKKIRCEPRKPKCLQCAKSRRECVM